MRKRKEDRFGSQQQGRLDPRAWRTAWRSARLAAIAVLGRTHADVDDVASLSAARVLHTASTSAGALVNYGRLGQACRTSARRAAIDLQRRRHGRHFRGRRRGDPLLYADNLGPEAAAIAASGPDPEQALLQREADTMTDTVLAAADRLPPAQSGAVKFFLAGRRPMPAAVRQALKAAVATLREATALSALSAKRTAGAPPTNFRNAGLAE
jgi:hypothetical protein